MDNSIISMRSLFNQHSVCSMICDGFIQEKLTEIYHGCQILVFLGAFWTDNCIAFISFVLRIMGNKPAYGTRRGFLGPSKSLQTHCTHIKLFLPFEDAFESNKNRFTFKIKNQFSRVPWLKRILLSVVSSDSSGI